MQPAIFLKMLVFHKFFSKFSNIQYFKSNNVLTKAKRCLLCWLLWIQKRILSLKLPDDWQISEKQNHIFQKSKSHEISSTDIHVGEDLEFIIRVFSWCILLDHEIYAKWKKTKKKPSNLIKVTSSYNICSGNKSQQAQKQLFVIQYQKFLIFLKILLFHFINSLSAVQFHMCS